MTKFSDLKLDPKVLKAVGEAGYESPTPIQAGAIPPALEGRDVLGIAQTGTGKTASFTLPMITLLGRGRARARMPRSLVLCPTRELAAQVAENFEVYAKYTRLTKALLIGGVSFGEQDKLIDRGVDVLIATPGRLLDHFERGKLLLTGVQIMVVDEADRMLDMGFIPDIERIFQLTPFTRQTLFFSATMAPEIERITDTFLHSPERIEVARQATTSSTITQRLVEITPTRRDQSAKQKRELLRALIRAEGDGLTNAIIFCNRKTDVDIVAKSLKAHNFDASPIHGDLDQRHRMATLDEFREGKLRLLVASDVAARGLDIPAVSHVFNFDLPSHAEDYVHRIGRTGRAGRLGTAISIATPADEKLLVAIESLVKQALPRAEAPEGFQLSNAALDAPRQPRERDGDRSSRNRSRRSGRDHHASGNEQPAEAARQPDARPQESRPQESRPQEVRPQESRRDERRDDRKDERRDERRTRSDDGAGHQHSHGNGSGHHHGNGHRSENGRNQNRRDDRHHDRNSVLGMGDHVPDFLTRSFIPSIIESKTTETEHEPETRPQDAAPASAEAQVKAPVAKAPVKAERASPVQVEAEAPAQSTPVSTADAAPVADLAAAAAAEVGATDAAAKPKPRRTRKPAAPKAETPAAEAEAAAPAEVAPKPRRTRATKAATTTDAAPVEAAPAEATDATEVAEKPKRRSRAKAAPAAEVAPSDAASEAAAPAEKPVRKPRARKPAASKTAAPKADASDNATPAAGDSTPDQA